MRLAALFAAAVVLVFAIARARGQDDCSQEQMARCAEPLKVFTDQKELSFVATKEELDNVCPNLNSGLRCIERYTLRCLTTDQRKHFNRLYAGTTMVIQELCREGPYQTEYLTHAPCMREAKGEHEDCDSLYQMKIHETHSPNRTDVQVHGEMQLRTLCCSFQDYLRCSQRIVKERCGEQTGKFTEKFLDRMSSSLIRIHCENYPLGSNRCHSEDLTDDQPRLLPSGLTLLLCLGILLLRK